MNHTINDLKHTTWIESFVSTAPYIQQLLLDDCAISICDHEQVRGYFPGRALNQNVKVGDPLLPASGVGRAIATGTKIVTRVGAELFGIPYVVVAVPIMVQGAGIVGGVSLSMSIEREERLVQIARDMQQYIQGVGEVILELNSKATDLTQLESEWKEIVNDTFDTTRQSEEVSNSIKQIAKETSILSLNSGIEAARQGANGQVFRVVAERMRQLSADVNRSADQISDNLTSIEISSGKLQDRLHYLEMISAHIKQTAEDLDEQIDKITKITDRLVQYDSQIE